MKNIERPIAIDLFAGAGGMSLGFEQAGFNVLAAVEIDPIHCATHEFNFPFCTVICKNAVDVTAKEIRQRSPIGSREIDVVFGGPPCQGFSTIGKRALDDPRNALVFHFVRLVVELKPKYLVLENVAGLAMGHHKTFLVELMEELQSKGYKVETRYQVLNAAGYGVPQDRRRLFLLGCRKGLPLPQYPSRTTRPAKENRGRNDSLFELPVGPTVWDAINDLPEVEDYPELLERDSTKVKYREASDYGKEMRGIRCAEDDYSYEREYDTNILTASLRTVHTPESIKRFYATLHGETEPISRFLKLDPNGICNTIRAGTASNRGAFTSPRPIHPFTPRCITVREAARLHSYPDWFRFHVTKWHGCRQVGNSVPPLLARSVAAQVIRALGVHPVKPAGKIPLDNNALLELNMSQAAERYGVHPHVIEPRTRDMKTKQKTESAYA